MRKCGINVFELPPTELILALAHKIKIHVINSVIFNGVFEKLIRCTSQIIVNTEKCVKQGLQWQAYQINTSHR